MFRIALVAAALLAAPTALACEGKPCGENCAMTHAPAPDDVAAAAGTKVTFAVAGMRCGQCASKITAALEGLDGVNAVAIDTEKGQARIAYDPAKVDEAKLLETIGGAGPYTATVPAPQG